MTSTERPVAVITGGLRGIGLGVASTLARAGYAIAITGIDAPDTAEATLADLRSHGGDAMYLFADIADVAGHAETVEAVLQCFGRIDCLVNNAGIGAVARGDFLELAPENFDRVMFTNLRGTVFFSQALALRLAETGIAVFDVRPGIIRTDMTAGVAAKYDAAIEGGLVPMKRWGEPADIGAICAALASGAFSFATGSVIAADGGLSIARL
jgi:NAD(P)-dependent dehydrogenase (short-subunit alcohol dehydrogenase family)